MAYGAQAVAVHDDRPHGWRRWVYSTNHKDIGTMYLVFAIVGGVIGGVLSMGMRAELMYPGMQIFGNPEVFNMLVSAHGLIMIFFTIMPAMIGGFGNWMVPADDRGAGHGVPAHEQHLLLAVGCRLCAAPDVALRPGASRRLRHRYRLDPLCSALHQGHAGSRHGFRDPIDPPGGCVLDPRCDQLHHHHLQYARAGHDAAQDAALRLVDPGRPPSCCCSRCRCWPAPSRCS